MRSDIPTQQTVEDLIDAGFVDHRLASKLRRVAEHYAIAVTPAMARLIDTSCASDPIAHQFVPNERELVVHPAELGDPIADGLHSPVTGIVHRYRNRVLLKLVNICPIYCRFCFRREMIGPGQKAMLTGRELAKAISYIAAHPEIREVIVTGGDPLVLSARRLSNIVQTLNEIDHVMMIRWHTRVPVVKPSGISDLLIRSLGETDKIVRVAIHANHPRELTADARQAFQKFHNADIKLISQSVLLKGVNDCVDTLVSLTRNFGSAGIVPYYLHHLDLAPGTNHFRVSIDQGVSLVSDMKKRLSDEPYPTYVLDLPGGYGKVPIQPGSVDPIDGCGRYRVVDPAGHVHVYQDIAGGECAKASD